MVGYETDKLAQIGLRIFDSPGATTGETKVNVNGGFGDALSIASATGDVCFGIEFKDCLPLGTLKDVHTKEFITVKSGGVSLGCGEIEYCSGFYKYTTANDTLVQYNRQRNSSFAKTIISVIKEVAKAPLLIEAEKDALNNAADGLDSYASLISKGYGIYHFSRRHDSYTAQLWLSNIPDTDNGCLSGVNLFKNTTAVANLVLDGVYGGKCNKSKYGSRRYTGSIIGDTIINQLIFQGDKDDTKNALGLVNGSTINGQTTVRNKKSFGTISLNISVPQ
jgi:hypothetical protein